MSAPAGGDAGQLALGVKGENGAGIFEQVGNDGRNAFAGAVSGKRPHVAVIRNADELVSAAAQEDFAGLILPERMLSNEFGIGPDSIRRDVAFQIAPRNTSWKF
jgi:hypothetical protein